MKIMKCKCGSENLELMVDATLSVPMDYYRKLSKTKLREKRILHTDFLKQVVFPIRPSLTIR